ncbi:MAG: hypothetical protein IT245_04995 [Bacteroidia bacterium]|nr:hypothetical protein [Bacteroidia bacterium]
MFITCSAMGLYSQTNVEIIGGDKLYGDQVKGLQYLVGNVAIRHNGVIIQCDSAIRKLDEGTMEGFGNIFIYQPDTFTLSGGDYLYYLEATKTATVTGKEVILRDKSMTLVTTSLQYNIQNQVGSYTNGANILNEGNTLKSKKGFYDRRFNVFHFKENVKLTSPDYTMEGDTLDYFSSTKTAFFYGPTVIRSKENTILCKKGWYNTSNETARFTERAELSSKNSSITADSFYYDRKQGIGIANGNLLLVDSNEMFYVVGQKGDYFQKTNISYIYQDPVAMQVKDNDTFFVKADTFYFKNDSLKKVMRAYNRVSVFQKEMKGRCDSMEYRFYDSTISLFYNPILWNQKNQISGDTMHIQLKNKRIHTMRVIGNAFLASEVKPNYYNQIAGKEMINRFDSNRLKSVLVIGNAQSIYYLRDNETDSAEYTGVNKVACGKMLIEMDSSKVKAIKFYNQPEGKMYPLNQFPESERNLNGMLWRYNEIPEKIEFEERMERKVPIVKIIEEVQPSKPTKKASKKKSKPKV